MYGVTMWRHGGMRKGRYLRWFTRRYRSYYFPYLLHYDHPLYHRFSYTNLHRYSPMMDSKNDSSINEKLLYELHDLLPQGNCGACGYSSCLGFAKALLSGNASVDYCRMMNQETRSRVKKLLKER